MNDRYNSTEAKNFLKDVNFREGGNLRKELITDDAKKIAEYFKDSGLTQSLMRKYYHEIKALEAKIEATEGNEDEKYKKNEANIFMLISKVNYDSHRDETREKIKALKDFIEIMIGEKIKGLQDFKDFVLLFEAVIGFAELKKR